MVNSTYNKLPYFLTTFIAIALCLFFSCNDDDDAKIQTHLTTENIRKLFPEAIYANNSRIIFKNKNGDVKILTIIPDEYNLTKTYNGVEYTVDNLFYRLVDEADDSYLIQVMVDANYGQLSGEVHEFIDISLKSLINPLLTGITVTEDPYSYDLYSESLELNGQEFKQVYSNIERPNAFSYSKIYYNPEFGVIGFHDESNVLFVLDSFD